MSLSKSIRFEIFARDGFTCQYCGRRPPEVVLEVDHLHPRSKGGADDVINLVTACWECNRGKGAKIVSEVAPRPDADLAFLKVQQELSEAKRFLSAKRKPDKTNRQICDALRETWADMLTDSVPADRVLIPWISRYGPEEVNRAIVAAVPAYRRGRFNGTDEQKFHRLLPWVGAILRNRAEDKESGAVN